MCRSPCNYSYTGTSFPMSAGVLLAATVRENVCNYSKNVSLDFEKNVRRPTVLEALRPDHSSL